MTNKKQLNYMTYIIWFKVGHSHQMAIVVLAAVIFLSDNLREKRSEPLTQ